MYVHGRVVRTNAVSCRIVLGIITHVTRRALAAGRATPCERTDGNTFKIYHDDVVPPGFGGRRRRRRFLRGLFALWRTKHGQTITI